MKTSTTEKMRNASTNGAVSPAYLALVHAFPLKPLRSEEELDEAIRIVGGLLIRMKSLTEGEHDYLECLGYMIEIYEQEHYPMPAIDPARMIRHYMEARDLTASEVARGAGIAVSTLSAILNGKRKLTLDHIGRLAPFFHVKPSVFLD